MIKQLVEEAELKLIDKIHEHERLRGGNDVLINAGTLYSIVGDIMEPTLQNLRDAMMEDMRESLKRAWKEMTDRIFENTMKGKTSVFEVTQLDWDKAYFTIDEFEKKVCDTIIEKWSK